jgi:hypothetical protein
MYFEYKLTWNDIYKSFFIKFLNNVTVKVFLARLINILYVSLYKGESIIICTVCFIFIETRAEILQLHNFST